MLNSRRQVISEQGDEGRVSMFIHTIIEKLFEANLDFLERRRGYVLLRIDSIRILLVRLRKSYYMSRKNSLKIWAGTKDNLEKLKDGTTALEYNLTGLHDISGARGLRIIRPLASIETYRPLSQMPEKGGLRHDLDYMCDAKVLTIGPRTEGEIFALIAYGFAPRNIRGLDLFSYSPFIDVGDMHSMPYEDNRFDITIAACVFVYSTNPRQAAEEMIRVTKNGGLICISQDTVLSAGRAAIETLGRPLITSDDYLELFGGNVDRIFFRHELPERLHQVENARNEGSNYTMNLIFRIKK
jgi:hypothetical protein